MLYIPIYIYIHIPKSNIAETAPKGFDSSFFNLQIRIDIEGERLQTELQRRLEPQLHLLTNMNFPSYQIIPLAEFSDTTISKHMIGFSMATCSHGCWHCAAVPSLQLQR